MKTLISRTLAVGAFAVAAFAALPALADAPYYFVDHINNKQALFTDSNCTGAYAPGCGKFTNACGTQFWAGQTTFDEGVYMLRQGEAIHIRRNSGSYDVVCSVRP